MTAFNRERLFVEVVLCDNWLKICAKYRIFLLYTINIFFCFFKYCLYLEQIEDNDIIELNHTSIGGYI